MRMFVHTKGRPGGILAWVAGLISFASAGAGAAAQDVPLAADFPEVYRVGGFDAPDWAEFSGPPQLAFDAAGRLYALDASGGHVVVIDLDGSLVRLVGRSGEGPGEFHMPMGFEVWPDGRLAINDVGHNAYQIFAPDGEFERFVRMGGGDDMLSGMSNVRIDVRRDPTSVAIVARGRPSRLGVLTDLMDELVGGEAGDAAGVDDRGLERLDLRGEEMVAETILEAWRPPVPGEGSEQLSASDIAANPAAMFGAIVDDDPWYKPELLWDLLPDGGIAYSDSTAYRIMLADRDGRVTRALDRPLAPWPVTRGIRTATREHGLRRLDEQGGLLAGIRDGAEGIPTSLGDQMAEAMREGIENREFFEEIPVLAALRATWDGSLWVVRRRTDEPSESGGPIDVMRPDAGYVGTFAADEIEMPNAFGPDGLVAYVELDELDIPSIVVRRLPAEVR